MRKTSKLQETAQKLLRRVLELYPNAKVYTLKPMCKDGLWFLPERIDPPTEENLGDYGWAVHFPWGEAMGELEYFDALRTRELTLRLTDPQREDWGYKWRITSTGSAKVVRAFLDWEEHPLLKQLGLKQVKR